MSTVNPLWHATRYGGNEFSLSKNIHGCISWRVSKEDKNYVAYFMNTKLGSWDEVAEAKTAVENRAKKELEYALNRLNTAPKEGVTE